MSVTDSTTGPIRWPHDATEAPHGWTFGEREGDTMRATHASGATALLELRPDLSGDDIYACRGELVAVVMTHFDARPVDSDDTIANLARQLRRGMFWRDDDSSRGVGGSDGGDDCAMLDDMCLTPAQQELFLRLVGAVDAREATR